MISPSSSFIVGAVDPQNQNFWQRAQGYMGGQGSPQGPYGMPSGPSGNEMPAWQSIMNKRKGLGGSFLQGLAGAASTQGGAAGALGKAGLFVL